jgi:predicted GNAT family acetyltransferase
MDFTHNVAASRYEARQDGELVGEAHYRLAGEVADFDHTFVPPQFEGRGIAAELVRYAMDDIRAAGAWKVLPTCSYVVAWFARHPDYADLRER